METRLYVGRPAPGGAPAPPVAGDPHTFRHGGRSYWLLAAYADRPPSALSACLFHADRRTVRWHHAGWADPGHVPDVTYELWHCNVRLVPVAAVVSVSDTTLTAARAFVNALPHRSLAAAVSTYAAVARAVTGRAPRRITALTRITQDGEHLVPAMGAPA